MVGDSAAAPDLRRLRVFAAAVGLPRIPPQAGRQVQDVEEAILRPLRRLPLPLRRQRGPLRNWYLREGLLVKHTNVFLTICSHGVSARVPRPIRRQPRSEREEARLRAHPAGLEADVLLLCGRDGDGEEEVSERAIVCNRLKQSLRTSNCLTLPSFSRP